VRTKERAALQQVEDVREYVMVEMLRSVQSALALARHLPALILAMCRK